MHGVPFVFPVRRVCCDLPTLSMCAFDLSSVADLIPSASALDLDAAFGPTPGVIS